MPTHLSSEGTKMHDGDEVLSRGPIASEEILRTAQRRFGLSRSPTTTRWRGRRAGVLTPVSVLLASFLLVTLFATGAGASIPTVAWSAPIAVDTAYPYGTTSSGMSVIACTAGETNPMCIGVGGSGIFASTDASGGVPSNWTVTPTTSISHEALAYSLGAATCAMAGSTPFCVAGGVDPNTGYGVVLSSPNPTGAATSWATYDAQLGGVISDISCAPEGNLCAAIEVVDASTVSAAGYVISTDDPSAADPTWYSSEVDTPGTLVGISCPSATMCVAVDSLGHGYYSQNLGTSSYPSWTGPADIDGTGGGFGGIACASASLCVAYDLHGFVFSINPNPGAFVQSSSEQIETVSNVLDAITCPSASDCYVSDALGSVFVINPETPGTAPPTATMVTVDPGGELSGISCSSTSLCAVTNTTGDVYLSTNPASTWSIRHHLDDGVLPGMSVSCATPTFCAVGTSDGALFVSMNANSSFATFTSALVPSSGDTAFYTNSLSCPSTALCVAVDGEGRLFTSTDPNAAVPTWTDTTIDPGEFIDAVACPTTSLCIALDAAGDVLASTDPTGGASAWSKSAQVDNTSSGFEALSCPSASLCAAIDEGGYVFTSTNPTGGQAAWSPGVPIDTTADELSDISCASSSLCVAVDDAGNVVSSPNPTAGAAAWTSAAIDTDGYGLSGISCPSATFCAAVDFSGNLLTSTKPADGATTWSSTAIDTAESAEGLAAISCPSAAFCVAVDGDGNALYALDPPGDTASWTSDAIDTGVVLTNVDCPSMLLCVAADSRGDVMNGALGLVGQTITFTTKAPSSARVGLATYTPVASASSGLVVTMSIDATSKTICSIANGVVHFKAAGSCVIDANQAGNVDFAAASQVEQDVAVAPPPTVTTRSKRLLDVKNTITLKITCKVARCSGSAKIVEHKAEKGKNTSSKTKTIVLASRSFSMRKNSSKNISLIVNATGVKRFANAKIRPAKVTLDIDVAGLVTPKTVTVT